MTNAIRLRLLVFAVIGAIAVVYSGAKYAGLTELVHSTTYDVEVHLARSGGLFERAEVTWRGVTVGRVADLEFRTDGVIAHLAIDEEYRIPAELKAEVHNRSAVGEQYLDLVPRTSAAPYLRDGAVIPVTATSTPVEEQEVILAAHRLLTSVDAADLATVIEESGKAFDGAGDDISRILDNSRVIVRTAQKAMPDLVALLHRGETVLRTQDADAEMIRGYLRNLDRVAKVLAAHDQDIRRILGDGTRAAGQIDALARGLSPQLRGLLARLLVVSQVTASRLAEVEETLVALPWALGAAQTPGREGRAHFTFVGSLDPKPCQQGYLPPAQWKSALELAPSAVPDDIGCDEPLSSVPRGAESVHPRN